MQRNATLKGANTVRSTHIDHESEEVAEEEDGDDGDEDFGRLLALPSDEHLAAGISGGAIEVRKLL